MEKGTLGKPKFKIDDEVKFKFDEKYLVGKVYIVDKCGTFEQNEEPSYDVMIEDFDQKGNACLVKHIRESMLENGKQQ